MWKHSFQENEIPKYTVSEYVQHAYVGNAKISI